MLRVLHCIYDDPRNPWVGGGGALRVWEIYRRLAGELRVTVASGNYPGARDETMEGVRYVRLGAPAPYAWSRLTYARAATRLLRAGDFDVAVFDFSGYTPIRIPRDRPVGLVVHMLHGPTAGERWGALGGRLVAAVERRLLRDARWASVTSQWMARQIHAITPATRVSLVSSGIPPEFFDVERRERDYILFYGRFDVFQKGIDTLLQAFRLLAGAHPSVRLRIAGRGKDAGRVVALARELGLEQRVEVLEGVDRPAVLELFSGALAMLMPSRLEGLPMAPAEAMAAGVPVIAAEVGALAELIESSAVGMLVPPDDPSALAASASALLNDPERRAAVSATARRSAQRFRWERVAREHMHFLQRIAAEGGNTSARGQNG